VHNRKDRKKLLSLTDLRGSYDTFEVPIASVPFSQRGPSRKPFSNLLRELKAGKLVRCVFVCYPCAI